MAQSSSPQFEIEEGSSGFGWTARENLEPGIILLEEDPVLQAPEFLDNNIPVCLTCACELPGYFSDNQTPNQDQGHYEESELSRKTRAFHCSSCDWPVCDKHCAEAKVHADNECSIFTQRSISFPPAIETDDLGHLICMIRGTSENLAESQKNTLLALKDDFDIPEKNQDLLRWSRDLGQKLKRLLKLSSDFDTKVAEKVFRIWKVNAMGCPVSRVYPQVARLNHSCVPNCEWTFVPDDPLKVRIRTTCPIKKGEALTVFYYRNVTFMGTRNRQKFIQGVGGFVCRCDRCLDPSERETWASALRLTAPHKDDCDCAGFFLPKDPLDLTPSSTFVCNLCQHEEDDVEVPFSGDPQNEHEMPGLDLSGASLEDLEDFLQNQDPDDEDEQEAIHLHENHWVFQSVVRAIVEIQAKNLEHLEKSHLEKFIQRVKYLLDIDTKIAPGLSEWRGEKFKFLSSALFHLLQDYGQTMDKDELDCVTKDWRQAHDELYSFYKSRIPPDAFESHSKVELLRQQRQIVENMFNLTKKSH